MWKIEVYPSLMEGAAIEKHECDLESLGAWLDAAGLPWRSDKDQPVTVSIGSNSYLKSDWDKPVPDGTLLKIRVLPRAVMATWAFWEVVLANLAVSIGISLLMRKKKAAPTTASASAKSLDTSSATANSSRLGSVVPELAGTFKRYPDYLTPPHRRFVSGDPRTQTVTFHTCIGPGQYLIPDETICIGNTPFSTMGANASYTIYQPNADLTGLDTNENWYSSPEVGATSGGSAGLTLNATLDQRQNIDPPSYIFGSNTVTRSGTNPGTWPETWDIGTIVQVTSYGTYSTQQNKQFYGGNYIKVWEIAGGPGAFRYLGLPVGVTGSLTGPSSTNFSIDVGATGMGNPSGGTPYLTPYAVYTCRVVSASINSDYSGFVRIARGETQPLGAPNIVIPNYFDSMTVTLVKKSYTAFKITAKTPTQITVQQVIRGAYDSPSSIGVWTYDSSFPGFIVGTSTGTASPVSLVAASAYGVISNFKSVPLGQKTQTIELDFFFPGGLVKTNNDGSLDWVLVQVQVYITDPATNYSFNQVLTYVQITPDQLGYTETFNLPYPMNPTVSVRRVNANYNQANISETVVWYAMKSKLATVNSYPNWTTMGISMLSGGKIGAASENQINLIATRILPTITSAGTISTTPSPTRQISAFALYIAKTLGYDPTQIDLAQFAALEAIWGSRGDTFDYVFDATTGKEALTTVLDAGFADITVQDGKLSPVRDAARTQFEQVYSAQNMLPNTFKRTFKAPRPDDTDGIELEYTDASLGYITKTIVCALPNSPQSRLQKLTLKGVTDGVRAWRYGMRKIREQVYRPWSYEFSTELDAMCSNYLSYVPIFDEIPSFHQSAVLTDISGTGPIILTISEPIDWTAYALQPMTCAIRGRNGEISPLWTCTQPSNASTNQVQISATDAAAFTAWMPADPFNVSRGEPLHVLIGRSDKFCFPALVTGVSPSGDNTVSVKAVSYNAAVYADDNNTPS